MFSLIVSDLQTKFSINSNICWDIKIQYIIESGFKVEASIDADQIMCQKTAQPPQVDVDMDIDEIKDKFKRVLQGSLTVDESLKLKQDLNQFSIKSKQNKRRLISESFSDYHIQEQWNNFQYRKGKYASITKPVKKGYQRISSPWKQNNKEVYRPRRILVPLKKLGDMKTPQTIRSNHGFQTIYVNFMVILLSSTLFFLHVRYVYRIFVLYECAKQATDRAYLQNIRLNQSTNPQRMLQSINQPGSIDLEKSTNQRKIRNIYNDKHSLKWENITLTEKLKFFNKWQLLSMVGNFFQICGSILLFVSFYTLEKNAEDTKFSFIFNLKERLIGFGSAIAWITIVQYVEYDHKHIIFSNLMGKVVRQWLNTLIGIFPIFMAFALVGYSLYNESIFFHSFSYTMTTLFATYHGDQISSYMNSINTHDSPLHQLYMLTFTCLFAMAVYNFFTSTIGLAWDEIKEKKKNKLLKQQLKQNYLIEEELYKAQNNPPIRNLTVFGSQNEMKMNNNLNESMYVSEILQNQQTLNSFNQSGTKKLTKEQSSASSQQQFEKSDANQEDEVVQNSVAAFDKLIQFIQKNKNDKSKVIAKIDQHKQYIWSDTISKKNQIELLFKEMIEFDSIIEVLDIDHEERDLIKAKYKKYFNFTINMINRLIDDISCI